MKTNRFLKCIAVAQALFAIRVIWRMIRTAGGERIKPVEGNVQALPLPLMLFLVATRVRSRWAGALNGVLLVMRIGVLFGTARAYRRRPWSYWLSPLCDLPVAVQLVRSAVKRRHVWRGRVFMRGGM